MTSTRLATAEQESTKPILSANEILSIWWRLVLQYSKGALTKPRDKLVAVAGLARLVALLIDSDYLAGLWRTDMPYALLWEIKHRRQSNGKPSERPLPYRAPSWSWASVGGEISGGSVRLRGLLRTISLDSRAGLWALAFSDESPIDSADCVVSLDCESDILGTSLHLMVIRSDPDGSPFSNVYVLILQPTGHRLGVFRRVGYASVSSGDLSVTELIQWIAGRGNKEWLEYEECNAENRYTIAIIQCRWE